MRQLLTGVVGIHGLHERLVDSIGDTLVAVADPRAELAPHEPERGVAHAVVPRSVEVSLVVVEVSRRGVVAKSDVDADIGLREGVPLARAHHLDGLAEQTQRSDGEHLIRVKGSVVGGDQHPSRL